MSIAERNRRAATIALGIMIGTTAVNALSWMLGALLSPAWFAVGVGIVLAVFSSLSIFRGSTVKARVWGILLLVVESIGGWITYALAYSEVPAYVGIIHTLWVVLFVSAWITRGVLDATLHRAYRIDRTRATHRAEQARIAENRTRELEYAQRVERTQNWVEHASRPGRITGYEPAELVDVVIERPAHMYGDPGVGLSGAGFTAGAVKRGQEGEVNFAKALVKSGLLDRFATFWSVHMPDTTVGASAQFQTDIDCVIVTGRAVWLIDVKNYNQGDVTWGVETPDAVNGLQRPQLVAVDNVTGGYVGEPRPMSRNMQLATDRFRARFADSGISHAVNPAVVLMPRREGVGVVNHVNWPDAIPAAALPDALGWLMAEPAFVPTAPDAALLIAILKVLVKDESGAAPAPGVRQRPVARTESPRTSAPSRVAPTPQPVPEPVAVVAPAADAAQAAPSAGRVCAECGESVEADWAFCYACGATV
jgi:hypothetical protein